MLLYIGKLLSAIATPLDLVILALAIAVFSRRRALRTAAALAALPVLLCGSERFSKILLRTLEEPYTGTSVGSAASAQAIVVLGGYLRFESAVPRPIEIGGAGDRLLCAAELYRAGKAPVILLSGGNVPFLSSAGVPPEAATASGILEEWGIPSSAILIEGRSGNTHENAELSYRILSEKGITRVLLVTSARHMRRASGSFRQTGLTVIPFAADFLGQSETPDLLLSLIPNASALVDSGSAIKEWSGLLVYRLRGWTR
jgi:uncharacterized SAM-binding protein YcdF (DUF218 family)